MYRLSVCTYPLRIKILLFSLRSQNDSYSFCCVLLFCLLPHQPEFQEEFGSGGTHLRNNNALSCPRRKSSRASLNGIADCAVYYIFHIQRLCPPPKSAVRTDVDVKTHTNQPTNQPSKQRPKSESSHPCLSSLNNNPSTSVCLCVTEVRNH